MLKDGCTVGMSMFVLSYSDNVWRSRRANAPRCAHFSLVISPSWITEQISAGKCAQRGASARREHQTMFKIVTWSKQTWTKHHNTQKESNICDQIKKYVIYILTITKSQVQEDVKLPL